MLRKKIIEAKEKLKYEIEDTGIKMYLILLLITLIAYPFICLYLLILKPFYKIVYMIIAAMKHGMKALFGKRFAPEEHEEEQRMCEEEVGPLIPGGKWKSFEDKEYWPDAYAVDGIAIYGAEGRTLIYVDENVEEFDVPDGVVNINHCCFACCVKLKRVSIPPSVKRIGKRAFFSCVSLREISIPESVTYIDEEVLMDCSSLESIKLPSNIVEISTRMFCNCRSLKEFRLPETVKVINKEAFRRCYSLEHIETSNKLETIHEKAFEECLSLKEFIMPESMVDISIGLFNGCHSLEHIHLSSQIKDFGGSCCRDCWNIKSISMSPMDEERNAHFRKRWEEYGEKVDFSKSENPYPESLFWTMGDALYFGIPRLSSVCLMFCFSKEAEYVVPSFVTNVKSNAFTSCRNLRTLRLSPYIKNSCDPWELTNISYDFIYENWPQVRDVVFDETLKHTEYAFGLSY